MKPMDEIFFGMSPARVGFPPNFSGLECTLNDPLSCVELPAGIPNEDIKKFRQADMLIHCGNLMEPEITRNVLFTPERLQTEFIHSASELIFRLAEQGVSAVTFDPGLDSALTNDKSAYTAISLLKRFAPVLEQTGIQLLLPFSLSVRDPSILNRMNILLKNIMLPWVRLKLEIRPHEMKPGFDPELIAGTIALETRSVLFIYDADAGNSLVPDHLTPWIQWFQNFGFNGPYFSAPFSSGGLRFSHECEKFIELIHHLNS